MVAVRQANAILSWMENMLEADRPPRWMWHLDEELIDHFAAVKLRHDNGGEPPDEDEEVPLWENELARDRMKAAGLA